MISLTKLLVIVCSLLSTLNSCNSTVSTSLIKAENIVENGCISFSVGPGTGCSWMCNYCSNQLGTNNYYFTDNVCTYETGGCVGNPIVGKQYTCCAASEEL